MDKRQIGHSNLYVSEMGLGCMSLGTDERKAEAIIKTAWEEGINFFDTADLYDFGVNEQIIGKALKNIREQVIIATKVGNHWHPLKNEWFWDPSKKYIKEAVKQSLKRLQIEYIDLYQLHGGKIEDDIQETIDAFEELKQEGFIREYGISSIRPNVINYYAQKSSIISVMMQYNILDRRPEQLFPLLTANQISIIARGPIAKGILTTKMLNKASTSVYEHGYLNYSYNELHSLLLLLKEKFKNTRTLTEVAFQFILSHSNIASVIPGSSSIQQLKENVASIKKKPLTEAELDLLVNLTKINYYQDHVIK